MRSRPLAALLTAIGLLVGAGPATAEVFLSKQEALEVAFPEADRIDRRSVVLSDDQAALVEKAARARLESRLVTLYTAIQDDRIAGYALIDVHQVRTLPEAFMVVMTPEGVVRSVRILAFYEPPEYKPSERWLKQFEARQGADADGFEVGGTIHGIAGSTLSARAVTNGVRRSLALYRVLVSGEGAEVATGPGVRGPSGGSR